MEEAFKALQTDVATCQHFENTLRGKPAAAESHSRSTKSSGHTAAPPPPRTVEAVLEDCMEACKASRKRHIEEAGPGDDVSDAGLSQYARFTDGLALKDYEQFLHYVPRLVNVVIKCLRMQTRAHSVYMITVSHPVFDLSPSQP